MVVGRGGQRRAQAPRAAPGVLCTHSLRSQCPGAVLLSPGGGLLLLLSSGKLPPRDLTWHAWTLDLCPWLLEDTLPDGAEASASVSQQCGLVQPRGRRWERPRRACVSAVPGSMPTGGRLLPRRHPGPECCSPPPEACPQPRSSRSPAPPTRLPPRPQAWTRFLCQQLLPDVPAAG